MGFKTIKAKRFNKDGELEVEMKMTLRKTYTGEFDKPYAKKIFDKNYPGLKRGEHVSLEVADPFVPKGFLFEGTM